MYDARLLRPKTTGRFSSLMDLYEQNYMLARVLIPELREMDGGVFRSRVEGCMTLELSQIAHERYTSTFNLTYRFSSELRFAREPDLMLRLYHDARTCEVMSGLLPSRTDEDRRVRDLSNGYRLNRFVGKWLSYCSRQGHSFKGCVAEGDEDAVGSATSGDATVV